MPFFHDKKTETGLYPPPLCRLQPLPFKLVNDQNVLEQVVPEIEKLERNGGDHGFDKYIRMLKTYQLPQPQTDNWC